MTEASYRYRSDSQSSEALRPRTVHRNGARFIARTWRGWGLASRTRRGLALMLRGSDSLPMQVYEIEAVDTGLLRPSQPDLILHRRPEITEAETIDPGPPDQTTTTSKEGERDG